MKPDFSKVFAKFPMPAVFLMNKKIIQKNEFAARFPEKKWEKWAKMAAKNPHFSDGDVLILAEKIDGGTLLTAQKISPKKAEKNDFSRGAARHFFREKRAIETFLQTVAHQIKTPLARISALVQFRENPQKICAEIADAAAMIDLFLRDARDEFFGKSELAERFSPAKIAKKIAKNFEILSNTKKVQIIFEEKTDGKIFATKSAFSRIFSLLLENAIKFSPENSRIKIVFKKENDEIWGQIFDAGPGISATEKTKILEKFSRGKTRKNGSGIGLSVVLKMLEKNGGRLEIAKNSPRGSVFSVIFPAV